MAGQDGAVHWCGVFFVFVFFFLSSHVFALHGTVSFGILSVLSSDLWELYTGTLSQAMLTLGVCVLCS